LNSLTLLTTDYCCTYYTSSSGNGTKN